MKNQSCFKQKTIWSSRRTRVQRKAELSTSFMQSLAQRLTSSSRKTLLWSSFWTTSSSWIPKKFTKWRVVETVNKEPRAHFSFWANLLPKAATSWAFFRPTRLKELLTRLLCSSSSWVVSTRSKTRSWRKWLQKNSQARKRRDTKVPTSCRPMKSDSGYTGCDKNN